MDAQNVVLKRNCDSYLELLNIPSEILLVYAVRHPFDTLTSHNAGYPHRKFWVSEKRWRDEYAALKELQARQPSRTITYVRYCDLVRSPDATQRHLANQLGLEMAVVSRHSPGY